MAPPVKKTRAAPRQETALPGARRAAPCSPVRVPTVLGPGRAGRVVGLVLLGNALWLARPFPGLVLSLVDALKLPDFGFPKFGTDLGDPETRRDHTTYPSQPVGGAIDVQRAGKRLRAELHRVTCPTLVLHGALDRTCPVSNAWRVAERLGTTDVQVRVLP